MQNRFNPIIANTLVESGWCSGRRVKHLVKEWKIELMKSDSLEMFPKAEEILLEFGGLQINPINLKGKFSSPPIKINPSLVAYEGDRFECFSNHLKINIYPIGEQTFLGRFFLGISEDGRVFEIMQNLLLLGEDFDKAISNLILGSNSKLIA